MKIKERNTLQKQLVYQTVHELRTHPDAQSIYEHLHETHPSVSRATVYRVLAHLAEQGRILRIPNPSGADAYDFNTTDHAHLVCRGCGRTVDVEGVPPEIAVPPTSAHYRVEGYSLIFRGLCEDCLQSDQNANQN